jgi:hypothetical protein
LMKSSAIFKHRSRRPSISPSETKSIDQLWVGPGRRFHLTFGGCNPLAFSFACHQTCLAIHAVRALTVNPPCARDNQLMGRHHVRHCCTLGLRA